jgi:hypothetical protein
MPSETSGHDHVQAALDASCAALLALESAAMEIEQAGASLSQTQSVELEAMELVRSAILELRRSVGSAAVNPLAYGFVRERESHAESDGTRERESDATPDGTDAQTSSFRIA